MADKKAQIMLDIILPKHISLDPKAPSDTEAAALYKLWKGSPPGTESFRVPPGMIEHMSSWKIKGLVDGMSDGVVLTDKGRKLIIEMVTNEPNAFAKEAEAPRYSVVKAKKSGPSARKMGKAASSSRAKPFNMRKFRNANNRNG